MKKRRIAAMLMAGVMMTTALFGCSNANNGGESAASTEDYPNGPVTVICPWGVN